MNRLSSYFRIILVWTVLAAPATATESQFATIFSALPVYNPLRYRIPATPEAQKLHKQILDVSHKLETLKAVPMDDPSIETRLKTIITDKIKLIAAKLDVLKADMKRRQHAAKKKQKQQIVPPVKVPKQKVVPKKKVQKKSLKKQAVVAEAENGTDKTITPKKIAHVQYRIEPKPLIGKDHADPEASADSVDRNKKNALPHPDTRPDTLKDITALKNSLAQMQKKIALLEKRTGQNRATGHTIVKPDPNKAQQPAPDKPVVKTTTRRDSPYMVSLPVAKKIPPRAPKKVRTTAIYPTSDPEPKSVSDEKAKTRQADIREKSPLVKAMRPTVIWDENNMYLPHYRPDFREPAVKGWQEASNRGNGRRDRAGRKRAEKKHTTEKKYASVEDKIQSEERWSEQQIFKGQNQCLKLFQKLNIVYTPKAPIKKGYCGTPAPIHFKGFGKQHKVQISPPATINCKATAVIARWMNKKVQPLAVKLLGAPISKIHNVASYNCRNRYNRKNGRISEHAFANALDVMAFTTAKGEKVDLLKHWDGDDNKAQFLRQVHALACKDKFGTVLGPEANDAHKNHFHLDLAKRRRSAYCE